MVPNVNLTIDLKLPMVCCCCTRKGFSRVVGLIKVRRGKLSLLKHSLLSGRCLNMPTGLLEKHTWVAVLACHKTLRPATLGHLIDRHDQVARDVDQQRGLGRNLTKDHHSLANVQACVHKDHPVLTGQERYAAVSVAILAQAFSAPTVSMSFTC